MTENTVKYEKRQLIRMNPMYKDLLQSLLKDGEDYSTAEVEKMIKNYLKKKVNKHGMGWRKIHFPKQETAWRL